MLVLSSVSIAEDEKSMTEIRNFFNGSHVRVTYREGGPIYGTYYIYNINYCENGQYYLQGYSEKEFASLMHLSPHTIHTYVKSIYRQFGVSSRAEFTSFFIRHVPKHHYFQLSSKMALSEDHSKPVYIQS